MAKYNQTSPNILFAFADDWGRYASCYQKTHGDKSLSALIQTPNIDRIADEGTLFTNAFVPAPTCTPCRSSLLSGRYFWQTRLGAILNGAVFDKSIPTFPVLLQDEGYTVGFSDKVWGPGTPINDPYVGDGHRYNNAGSDFGSFSFEATKNLQKIYGNSEADKEKAKTPLYTEVDQNFTEFLDKRDLTKPFFYWCGPTNTHREWQRGSGKELWDIDPDTLKGRLPDFFPDVETVREDVSDYLGECMAFDRGLGVLLEKLEAIGELDNTLIVVSGDHGIPGFPRAKCNLYDIGTEVALMARLPGTINAGRIVEDMVNLMDLAPTFLEAGGAQKPEGMISQSLMPVLVSEKSGQVDAERTFVITGRERHVASARDLRLPYPQRALRTQEFLYIRNFEPERWPMGDPKGLDDMYAEAPSFEELEHTTRTAYADFDASPTKAWMIHNRAKENQRELFTLGFSKRPGEELYNIEKDSHLMCNLSEKSAYQEIKKDLSNRLISILTKQNDPRVSQKVCPFEHSPYTDPYDPYENVTVAEERWNRS